MADDWYYFGCTVSFQCPICGRESHERMVYQARRPDAQRVARAIARQSFDCQLCGAALVSRKRVNIRVVPADAEGLQRLGFPLPRAA